MGVRIIADSSSDVPQETAREWGVRIIPLKVRFGDTEYEDGVTITNREFYEKLIETDVIPKTSQITPYEYGRVFEEETADGDEAVCLTISSGVSGCIQSATLAAEEYEGRVHVVDTKQFCISYYILVEYAVRLRDEGRSAAEIADEITRVREKATVLSVFDTLEYLKLGGRLSSTAAFAGSILAIKPVITITNGLVDVIGKARGSKNGNNMLIQQIRKLGGIDPAMPHCLGYTGLSDELLRKYAADSADLYEGDPSRVPVISVGSTIGTYAGPGAIAFAFFPKEAQE
ncbi:MAG: DegV family protein [Lachnospiraceae bacterium]|nr:DegV family protein [Lachnospiraceae bacterium]